MAADSKMMLYSLFIQEMYCINWLLYGLLLGHCMALCMLYYTFKWYCMTLSRLSRKACCVLLIWATSSTLLAIYALFALTLYSTMWAMFVIL